MPVVSLTLAIVCMAGNLAAVNEALRRVARDAGDANAGTGDPLTIPLILVDEVGGSPATAYGANWRMDGATQSGINQALSGLRPLRGSEGTILRAGDPVPALGTQRWWVWDAESVPFHDAIGLLGLQMDPGPDYS